MAELGLCGYLGEEISKQIGEGAAWFLWLLMVKYEEKDKLKKEWLSKKEADNKDLENSQSLHIAK